MTPTEEGRVLQLLTDQLACLTEIRDLLARPLPIDEAPPEPTDCPHPEEARINLRAMGDPGEHFKCRACGRLVQFTR